MIVLEYALLKLYDVAMLVDFNKILFATTVKLRISPFSIPITLTSFNCGALTNIIILSLDNI